MPLFFEWEGRSRLSAQGMGRSGDSRLRDAGDERIRDLPRDPRHSRSQIPSHNHRLRRRHSGEYPQIIERRRQRLRFEALARGGACHEIEKLSAHDIALYMENTDSGELYGNANKQFNYLH